MTLRVLRIPPELQVDDSQNTFRIATPVRGVSQWHEMAEAANWVLGNGGALAWNGVSTTVSAGSSTTHHLYLRPRATNETWLLTVTLRSTSNTGSRGTVTLSGSAYDFTLSDDRPNTFHYVKQTGSTTAGGVTLALAVTTGAPSSVVLQSASIHDIPRRYLSSTGGEPGVHETSCTKGSAIYHDPEAGDKYSAQAVYEQLSDARTIATRTLFHWFHPTGLTVTTTAYTAVFALPPAIQVRDMTFGGSATRNARWTIYASSVGGSGDARITMATGATNTITVTSTSAVWHSEGTLVMETDDLSQANTIRGGTRETATIEIRRVGGTSITIYGVSIGELG